MAKNVLKRLSNAVLMADEDAFIGLKTITGYQSPNPAYDLKTVTEAYNAYRMLREAEAVAAKALAAARDAAVMAENAFHDSIIGAKTQVKAIYGDDSDEVAAMGLKKKSEKKTGNRNGKNKPPAAQ